MIARRSWLGISSAQHRIESEAPQVSVSCLADIVGSKQAANRLKDQRVLPVLREILARRLHEGGASEA